MGQNAADANATTVSTIIVILVIVVLGAFLYFTFGPGYDTNGEAMNISSSSSTRLSLSGSSL